MRSKTNSPTWMLIEDLVRRRDISIGHIYFGLLELNHTAADIISDCSQGIFCHSLLALEIFFHFVDILVEHFHLSS